MRSENRLGCPKSEVRGSVALIDAQADARARRFIEKRRERRAKAT
ncbi:hypothetical protein [Mycetohabitans sp. B2]|nr:hypothetical protein [Mycetohabitans sp. B2]